MDSQSHTVLTSQLGSAKSSGDRNNVRGQATRLSILLAAERLFSQEGISAVPLRNIGKAAGQRNHAAVQYHFGDRDEVIKALMEYRGQDSERVRSEMVTGLMLSGSTPSVADVIGAFVHPLATHFEEGNHYLTFLSMYVTQEGGYQGLGADMQIGSQVIMLRALLGRLLPDIPEEILTERWWLVLSSAVHGLAMYQAMQRKHGISAAQVENYVEDLVRVLGAGIAAPVQ